MKIILIGPGVMSIPPNGWGAVESIVWDYYELLIKRNYDVFIVNNKNLNDVIHYCNNAKPDIIHIMYDDHIIIAPFLQCAKIFYMSHYAYITQHDFENKQSYYFNGIFKKVIENKSKIVFNAISNEIKQVYSKYGFDCPINIICNGARADLFRYVEIPKLGYRSIYVAKIEFRKAQYKYQNIFGIDFAGNYHDTSFDVNNSNYLGEWTKPVLYERLTEYGNLILLSTGEADPLVVKEALIAGLGVVVSECSAANLDLTRDFITVIPNERLDDLDYVTNAIEKNRQISVLKRAEIREYALANFDWEKVIDKFIELF
jgi:glycosyltransferase involved in cell wall biosynthesis